ncbi:MAG: UvrD-helicase domain-containing protein, partial [Solirubrobacterales bacterium]|nr:UvrD-helicase domain-containing protein [Solirubrobacterales bacterium]
MAASPADDGFERALALREGPALVLGRAGSGRTELIARRVAALVSAGVAVDQIMVLTQSAANQAHLRERVAELLSGSYEEVSIETWPGFAERMLRDYALEAGLDPFFETASPADRLALLLDHLDDLPLRRHEIRGNPAGLLARLLERIDALKAEGIGPAELRDRARAAERGAPGRADREVALREIEFSELFDRHDATMLQLGVLDEGELILELGRLLTRHSDLSDVVGDRLRRLLVDELE